MVSAVPAPESTPQVRWGLTDAAVGLLLGTFATMLVGALVISTGDYDVDAPTAYGAWAGRLSAQAAADLALSTPGLPISLIALLQIPLWCGLLGALLLATYRRGNGPVADFGFYQKWSDVPVGLGLGVLLQAIVVPLLYLPFWWAVDFDDVAAEARALTDKATDPIGVLLLATIVVIGAPIVEELFFRGLLYRSIQHRWGAVWAIVGSALVFGFTHLQLLQLPGLVMFGLVTALLVYRTDRLGTAIWTHVGFNGYTVVALLTA
jgi:membrane protease YdiL (CAAX protease family)